MKQRQRRLIVGDDVVSQYERSTRRQRVEAHDQIGRLAREPLADIQIGSEDPQLTQDRPILSSGLDIDAETSRLGCLRLIRGLKLAMRQIL